MRIPDLLLTNMISASDFVAPSDRYTSASSEAGLGDSNHTPVPVARTLLPRATSTESCSDPCLGTQRSVYEPGGTTTPRICVGLVSSTDRFPLADFEGSVACAAAPRE